MGNEAAALPPLRNTVDLNTGDVALTCSSKVVARSKKRKRPARRC